MNQDSSGSPPDWLLCHQTPERVRLRHPERRVSPDLARGIEHALRDLPGVRGVRVSGATGSVIVEHERGFSLEQLRAALSAARPEPRAPGSKRAASGRGGRSPDQRSSQKDEGAAYWLARVLHDDARKLDTGLKHSSGGRLTLKQMVLAALSLRVVLEAAASGVIAWSTVENAVELLIAWTLYENPAARQEAQRAQSVASPGA